MSSEYSKSEIEQKVWLSIALLCKNDSYLLENAVHERSITHKLAEYLQVQFSDFDVDCEYNLDGIKTKLLPRICDGEKKEKVFPDIIVHVRGTRNNLLVIEAKPDIKPDECDQIKLELFTSKDECFQYKYGLAIGFNRLEKPVLRWFTDGKLIE